MNEPGREQAGNSAIAWRAALAGMTTLALAMGIGRFVYTPILPHMIAGGALDTPAAGLVASANFLAYLLGALAASLSVFAPNRRQWFFAALAASAVSTLAMGLTDSVAGFILWRLLSGVASAFALVFSSTLILATLQLAGKSGLSAVHFAGVGVGIAISAAGVSILADSGATWKTLWIAAGLLALAGLIVVMLVLPPARGEKRPAPGAAQGDRFTPLMWLLIASYGIFGFGYVITGTFLNTIASADPLLRPVEPWVWLVVGLSGIPSVWVWNRVAARTGIAVAYALACLVEAAGVAALLIWRSPLSVLLSGALLGATLMAITALGLVRARTMAGEGAARAIALMTASFGLGQMLGPLFAARIHESTGSFDVSLAAAVVALVLAALLILQVRRRERRQQQGQNPL